VENAISDGKKEGLSFQNHVKIGKKEYCFEVKKYVLGAGENEERISKLTRQIIRIVEESAKRARSSKG
jgi:hypothetical protein